jgi:hypothetical protein
MKARTFLLLALCAMFSFTFLQAQDTDQANDRLTDEGALLFGGNVSFSSGGGDLYGGDDRQNQLTIMPMAMFFLAKDVAVGGELIFRRQWDKNYGTNAFGIGPKVGVLQRFWYRRYPLWECWRHVYSGLGE